MAFCSTISNGLNIALDLSLAFAISISYRTNNTSWNQILENNYWNELVFTLMICELRFVATSNVSTFADRKSFDFIMGLSNCP